MSYMQYCGHLTTWWFLFFVNLSNKYNLNHTCESTDKDIGYMCLCVWNSETKFISVQLNLLSEEGAEEEHVSVGPQEVETCVKAVFALSVGALMSHKQDVAAFR